MALSPQFLDELKHRFTLSDVIGRSVKLIRRGRESTGLCPFHSEKSPSFTVNDQKAFYHCFGCGEHGGVIDFVMKTQGMSFPEAVEVLAGEVGMEVPKPSREQMERDKTRSTLSEVMDAVSSWYQAQLLGQVGKSAHAYIKGRGLSAETIKKFGLGFAPSRRTALKEAMLARDIEEDQLIETGMLIKPESGGASYDRFRDRLMFPISDRQGRTIAFGGRALSKDAKAKYLNSPETTLFHKGATLYNWANARAASYDGGQIMVVEGYMDVIALAQYGIDYAVAPLGTALTEEQIGHLWQMVDEPVLAFDGDKAGVRASLRAVERALPMLRPGKSLRFISMPDGDDPDTLVQREGKGAIDQLIDTALPLASMLWNSLTAGSAHDTPERKAGFEKKVFGTLAEIADENVKKLYQSEFRNRIFKLFRGPQSGGTQRRRAYNQQQGAGQGKRWVPNPGAPQPWQQSGGLGRTAFALGNKKQPITSKFEKLIIISIFHHPEILVKHEETLAEMPFNLAELGKVRDSMLELISSDQHLESGAMATHLEANGLRDTVSKLLREKTLRNDWWAWSEAALSDALTGFEHLVSRFQHMTAAKLAYEQAEYEYKQDMTDENTKRFIAAQQAFRDLEEKEADKDGYRLESGRISFN